MNVVGMDIEVVKKKIKNMHLSVLPPDGKVRVSVPLSISEGAIELFVISKIGWIKKQVAKYQQQPRQTERELSLIHISHHLAERIIVLSERYAKTLPELEAKVDQYEKKVKSHLERMGFRW